MESSWNKKMTNVRPGIRQIAMLLMVGLMSVSAFAQINGNMVSRLSTIPRGAALLNDNNGGHWWVTDQNLGLCELTAQNFVGQPPFVPNFCSAVTVKSGGQIVVGTPAPSLGLIAGSKFVYVADDTAAGINVVRFVFSPNGNGGNGGFTGSTIMKVQNATITAGGGGGGGGGKGGGGGVAVLGGRPVALALTPHKGLAANGGSQDLYVGYVKSGDVMRIDGVDAIALNNTAPTVAKVGTTSDGKGVNSFVFFGPDLYLAEIGGLGLSKIADPSGITRTACSSAAPCIAIPVSPSPSTAPGGLSTDWTSGSPTAGKVIFVGDAALAGIQNRIMRFDPTANSSSVYSLNISPAYNEPDATGVSTNWTTYAGPMALAYNPANGDLMVGDDPQATAAAPIFQQAHFWKVSVVLASAVPSITSILPSSGSTLGNDSVTITGTNLATYDGVTGAVTALPSISFGLNAGSFVACSAAIAPPPTPTPSTCTVRTPSGFGTVDIRVTIAGQTSAAVPADRFTYVAPGSSAISITSISPINGASIGGTHVTINGQNLAAYDAAGNVTALPDINFGAGRGTNVSCQPAPTPIVLPVFSVCTTDAPAQSDGSVDVQATLNAQTSPANPLDLFTYATPGATLYAWGVQAPKGGAVFLAGALGGHWWSSDEGNGFCRQDLMSSAPAPFAVAGNTLHALNFSICGPSAIGSAGQAVYDPNVVPGTAFHYVYVPDNAVKSTAVWRLTFDPATETLVADPVGGAKATAMAPLADVTTLKPNGMALGPDGNLYVADLTDQYIRKLSNAAGDPRTQTVTLVAATGDARGANGTAGFIGNLLYIPGNRAAQFFDITQCPLPGGGVCGMASVPAPTGVFVAGLAADAARKRLYFSNSPGGSGASILRYDASHDTYAAFAVGAFPPDTNGVVNCLTCTTGAVAINYIGGGLLPPPGTPNGTITVALTAQRPWDDEFHPTVGIPAGSFVPTGFSFVFGMAVDPAGNLMICEDPAGGSRTGRGTLWTVPFLP
jgi:hypothetical protein